MTPSLPLQLLTLLLMSASLIASAEDGDRELVPWARGEVRNEDGTLLYREFHLAPEHDARPVRVEYRAEDGGDALFAEKTLDYSVSATAPAMDFVDRRRNLRIVTRYPDPSEPGRLQLAYYPERDGEPERDTFDTDSLIVDAGFDPYIQQHWDRLVDDERIVARFLVPSRSDTVRMSLQQVDTDRCETPVDDIRCFEVRPAGALRLVGWFVDPIRLAYTAEPRRLVLYHGQGNIPDESGDPRQVRIHYEYDGL
ncbi:MAG: hypothetical protein ACQETO_01645 [Pseudomonadota bacterium]